MSVKIRFSRLGRKNRPFWRVVAIDSRKKRDGAFLDNLGSYDPIKHEILSLDVARINHWVAQGAECSPAVTRLVKKYNKSATSIAA